MTCEQVNVGNEGSQRFGLARLAGWFRARQQHRRARAGYSTMLKLEDHLLSDIGVTRDSVEWANRLPVSKDAGAALARSISRKDVKYPR